MSFLRSENMSTDTTPSITKVLSQLQNLTEPSNFTIAQKDDSFSCRPWSKQDFASRVRSYKTYNWFAKPKRASPLILARFGFINTDIDTVECVSCQAKNTLTISDPLRAKPEQTDKIVDQFFTDLHASHNPLCPWLNNSTPEIFASYPVNASSIEIQENFLTRLKGLHSKTIRVTSNADIDEFVSNEDFIGFLKERFHENDKLDSISDQIKLALIGWTYVDTNDKPSVHCEQCQRTVPIEKYVTEKPFNIVTEHKAYCPWLSSLPYLKSRLTNVKTIRIPTTEEMAASSGTANKRTEDPLILVKRVFDGNKRVKS